MMAMFQAGAAFSLSLLALIAGIALIVWMRMHAEHTTKFFRGLAYLAMILSMVVLICISYTTAYWFHGSFKKCPMMESGMMNNMNMGMGMGMVGMRNMPMMNKMQGQPMMNKNPKTMPMQQSQEN